MARSEADLIARWEHDPQNAPFISPWPEERHVAGLDDPDLQHLMVEHDGNAVGFVLLAGLQNENRSVEFRRIVIVEKGRGYGRAAVELIKRHCFTALNAHRLWLDVVETNQRARSLYESAGFTEEGVLRESLLRDDGFASLVLMSILAWEFVPPGGDA